jgi:hypothetical protein
MVTINLRIIYWIVISIIINMLLTTTYWADFYSINNNSIQCINEHWVNRAIENRIWSTLFVPTKTSTEWSTFRGNKPTNVFEFTTSWNTWTWWTCSANPTWSWWSWRSACSVSCWWWTQTRTRTCTNTTWTETRNVTCDLSDGRTQLDSCCTWTKPSTTQSCTQNCVWNTTETRACNTQSCYCILNATLWCVLAWSPPPTYTYSWQTSAWSTCSVSTCWWWTQTRTVSCRRSDWVTVANSNCTWTAPATSQACNTNACPPVWCSARTFSFKPNPVSHLTCTYNIPSVSNWNSVTRTQNTLDTVWSVTYLCNNWSFVLTSSYSLACREKSWGFN